MKANSFSVSNGWCLSLAFKEFLAGDQKISLKIQTLCTHWRPCLPSTLSWRLINSSSPLPSYKKYVEHYCEIYWACLQDHDFAVGPRHLLVPIVLAQCEIDKEGVSYSGVTQIGVWSSKHNNSSAFTHKKNSSGWGRCTDAGGVRQQVSSIESSKSSIIDTEKSL